MDNSIFTQLGFQEGKNGLFYSNISGFLYSAIVKGNKLILAINLPSLSKNEKGMISCYVKESANRLKSAHFIKDGMIMTFEKNIFENSNYLIEFAKHLSSFLISAGIEFDNPELNISLGKNKIYVFSSSATLDVPEEKKKKHEKKPEVQQDENSGKLQKFLSSKRGILIVFAIFAIIFICLVMFYVKIAAAFGYIIGWLISLIFLKRNTNLIWLKSAVCSLVIMIVAALVAYIAGFLTQTEIYSIYDYVERSLSFQNCIYSVIIGFIFSLFGIYSTLPKRNDKKEEISDF